MATQTSISPAPKSAQFYPYRLQVTGLNASGVSSVLFESEAAYEPERGANPNTFDNEAPTNDRILLPKWREECEAKQTVILSKGAWRKRFEVSDVLPVGQMERTLLIVTPERRA
jgi:hypothetical protein